MGKLTKNDMEYIEIHRKQLKTMSNKDLFGIFEAQAMGDDYDGGFTRLGDAEFTETRREFMERLVEVGFLERLL